MSNVMSYCTVHCTCFSWSGCMEGRDCSCYTSAFGRLFDKSFHSAYCPSHWHTPVLLVLPNAQYHAHIYSHCIHAWWIIQFDYAY